MVSRLTRWLTIISTVALTAGLVVLSAPASGAAQASRWYFSNQLVGGAAEFTIDFGAASDTEFYVGDWDGNGIDDLVRRRGKDFTFLNTSTRQTSAFTYGKAGDEVLVGDWDGDGDDTLAVRRGRDFFVKNTMSPGVADVVIAYGKAGDEVFVGDWDGDGDDTLAVRRGNVFYARNSVTGGNADRVFAYGRAGDKVLVGDWNGDRVDTFAVRRANIIYLRNDFATAPAQTSFGFGKASDQLFPGDWNGDRVDTFAVRRAVSGAYDPKAPENAVNKQWDGSSGIYPSSPYPVPAGFPTSATTGVPSSVNLKRSGSLVITKAGTVINGLDIEGSVEIRADNVTIRNSRITSTADHPIRIYQRSGGSTYKNFVIEDSRIRGVGSCEAAIGFSNYTARRVHISGCSDGAKAFSNTTIVDSYIVDRYKTKSSHNDGIQSSGGSNIVIRHNTILGAYQKSTSAIKVTAEQNSLSNVLIEDNYLSGGAYSLYTTEKTHRATNIDVIGNTFEKGSSLYGDSMNTATDAVYKSNTRHDPT